MSIKTWRETIPADRADSEWYKKMYMQAEIDDLRTALQERDAEIANLEDSLRFVERWAVHHANKPGISAENALGCIAHYPPIKAITKSYVDGVPSHLPDPYEAITAQRKVLNQALEALSYLKVEIIDGWDARKQQHLRDKAITAIQEVLHANKSE